MKSKLKLKKLLFLLLAFYAGYILLNQQITMSRIKKEMLGKQQEVANLKEKNERLQDEIKMSKTDGYIEKLARERLGLIKEGETPVISIEDNK